MVDACDCDTELKSETKITTNKNNTKNIENVQINATLAKQDELTVLKAAQMKQKNPRSFFVHTFPWYYVCNLSLKSKSID